MGKIASTSENGQTKALRQCYILFVSLDPNVCYEAVRARDRRFDGCFFVAVKTTGIYCRPICPARQPARDRCVFFARAAEAERAGFRACFRCRPELAPGNAVIDSKSRLVRLAAHRIASGYLNEHSVDDLASSLGVTARHLRRALEDELGVSPVEFAQTQRLSIAKQLLQDTSVPLSDVAHAAGFGSIRRFNALFRQRFARSPSAIRRTGATHLERGFIAIRLDYRPPLDWQAMLSFLAARAIPGVESVEAGTYRRSAKIGQCAGVISVRAARQTSALVANISLSLVPMLSQIVPRLRALFDLDARPTVVQQHLVADPILMQPVRSRPGLRVPGAFDGFELGVRAILGQQVSVTAATTLSGRFAARYGSPSEDGEASPPVVFPTAQQVAAHSSTHVKAVGIPLTRAQTIVAFARAIADGNVDLSRGLDPLRVIEDLQCLPGIGPWTAQYIAMRALNWPNAFPSGDLVLRKALGAKTASEAEKRTLGWQPWRAYGALHLWTVISQGG